MKKLLLALIVAASIVLPALAQEAAKPIWDRGDNVSNLTYRNVQVYKVYDQLDSYIVLYEKQSTEIGQLVIPKKWASGNVDRKLVFHQKVKNVGSYMSVFYKDGEFYKVILNVPLDKRDAVWSVAPNGMQVDTNIESLKVDF
ncbi:MAG: hypothetical protein IJ828_05905 [Treponema sp.]|nr:hypothetical protein [Treponema sp.]